MDDDFTLIRGDTYCLRVEVVDNVAGTPIDLTGLIVRFTARLVGQDVPTSETDDDDAAIHVFQDKHVDAAGGITELTLSSKDTNVDPGNYNYDVQYSDDGPAIPIVGSRKPSRMAVIADVTRTN